MRFKTFALTSALVALCGSGTVLAGPRYDNNDNDSSNEAAMGLVRIVRQSAGKYRNINTAIADGYSLATGCVSGSQDGAMGVHYIRTDLLGDGLVDPATPELLVYEPTRFGALRLVAVEFLAFKDAWHATQGDTVPPAVFGQTMMVVNAPNRFLLPVSYGLHVWAFKHNPAGMFAMWNPGVRCDFYVPPAA